MRFLINCLLPFVNGVNKVANSNTFNLICYVTVFNLRLLAFSIKRRVYQIFQNFDSGFGKFRWILIITYLIAWMMNFRYNWNSIDLISIYWRKLIPIKLCFMNSICLNKIVFYRRVYRLRSARCMYIILSFIT